MVDFIVVFVLDYGGNPYESKYQPQDIHLVIVSGNILCSLFSEVLGKSPIPG
jgi:hypothetical protein